MTTKHSRRKGRVRKFFRKPVNKYVITPLAATVGSAVVAALADPLSQLIITIISSILR